MEVNLENYIFPVIDYDPTENPRGVITADEWNTITNLLKTSINYTNKALQDIFKDMYTASQLSSKTIGKDGARLISVNYPNEEDLPGVSNVAEALLYLKGQIKESTISGLTDGIVESRHLSAGISLPADATINGKQFITADQFTTEVSEDSTAEQIVGADTLYELFKTKQDTIVYGTAEPDANTPGTIYFQYTV